MQPNVVCENPNIIFSLQFINSYLSSPSGPVRAHIIDLTTGSIMVSIDVN